MTHTDPIYTIKAEVSNYFGFNPEAMQEHTRKNEIVVMRQLSMYFAKKYTSHSTRYIASLMGVKMHSTVISSCKAVQNQITTDKNFSNMVYLLDIKLKEVIKTCDASIAANKPRTRIETKIK